MNIPKNGKIIRIINSRFFSFAVTVILFVVLYIIGMINYEGFLNPQVFFNLLIDNAALIIATVGISFVLLTGGIDISIGAVVALTCMVTATLLEKYALPAGVVMFLGLLLGTSFGLIQGYLITEFNMQPFIVTLAGQFFARGLTAVISRDTINISNPTYKAIASARFYVLGDSFISAGAIIAIITLLVGSILLKYTRFGRSFYALGGSETSANLMGLPTHRIKITSYMVCGFCSSLAGLVYSFVMLSGYPLHAIAMEMDAISSSVIGGTLLSGGVCYLPGTLVGVLIQGVIQTFITFDGTLSAWWTRIVMAALLCVFIVMQTLILQGKKNMIAKK